VMSPKQIDALILVSPIVLDLDGNGVHTSSASQGVTFDLNATGNAHKVGWVSATDGLLVRDINHDGKINDGSELFGVGTKLADGTRAGNGFAAMAAMDTNHDGKLSIADKDFKELQVWVDANHDGKTDAGELHKLSEFGIVSLDLHGLVGKEVDQGNLLGLTSSYTTADGAQHAMADVWFAKDVAPATSAHEQPPVQLHELLAPPATEVLPPAASTPASTPAAPTVTHGSVSHDSASLVSIDKSLLPIDENKAPPLI